MYSGQFHIVTKIIFVIDCSPQNLISPVVTYLEHKERKRKSDELHKQNQVDIDYNGARFVVFFNIFF